MMPLLRDHYGSPRYPEPLMGRDATTWPVDRRLRGGSRLVWT